MSDNQSAESTVGSPSDNFKSNNNEASSSCVSSKCIEFSKNLDLNHDLESSKPNDTFTSQTRDISNLSKNVVDIKNNLNLENATTYKTQVGIVDKCPSRWLPNQSNQQKHAFEIHETDTPKNIGAYHAMRNDIQGETYESQNSLRTKSEKVVSSLTMNECDQKQLAANNNTGCDEECKMSSQKTEGHSNGIEREICGKEAIEELAAELNKAATTIQDFSQNECDEQILKQLNDEQLFKLLEEAYHSKKLDEKNKSSIFKEILEDVHESINDAEVKHSSSVDIFEGSTPEYFKSDTLTATKELLQTKILGTDESRPRISAISPKLNRITNRVPSTYPWKDTGKNGKDGIGSDIKNEKLESSPCLWMARTSSIKSSDVRHSLDEHFRSNKIGTDSTNSTDGNEEARHETKLGAIQKNIHQNIASSSARNLNENLGLRSLDENGNPIHMSTMEHRSARPNLGLGSVSMGSCATPSTPCRQLRPLSIYRHNPAFHSQHVAAVGGSNQVNMEDGSNLSDSSPPAPTLQQRHQQQRIPSPTPIPSPFSSCPSSNVAIDNCCKPMTEDMEKVANINSSNKTLRKKKKIVKATMIKAEEIDGYRGCDDLDSILQFIEKGDEKKIKSGSKRSTNTGRNRLESPSLSASVSAKQRSKQQQSEKTNGGAESNQKTNSNNKKSVNKRSQTPGDSRILQNTEIKQPLEQTPSSSPTQNKEVDKKDSVTSTHSNLNNETASHDENKFDDTSDKARKVIEEVYDTAANEKINTYEEEEDDDDTPFVMIRRVNNHSSTNKFTKGKTHNENNVASQGKNQNMNGNNVSRNNKHTNKNNPNPSGRNTLKRKSKRENNDVDGHLHKDSNDSSLQQSKQASTTSPSFTAIKSNAPYRSLNNNNNHQSINDTLPATYDNNSVANAELGSKASSAQDLELSNSDTNKAELNQSSPLDLPISFSSVVQAKKVNKSTRGKSKNKGGNGLNHKQYIDAALDSPVNSSKRHNDAKQDNNTSDSPNKSKISNTFVAEAMLPEPVLEYSRAHSSHSPPPFTSESDDLKNEHSQLISSCNSSSPIESTYKNSEGENNFQINRNVSDASSHSTIKRNDEKQIGKYSDMKNNFTPNNEQFGQIHDNMEYGSGDNIEWNSTKICDNNVNEDLMKTNQCYNKYPKSYSSALISSHDGKDVNESVQSNVSIMNVKNTRENDSDIEIISHAVHRDSRIEIEPFAELEQTNITNPVCKTGLSTSTSPISSRSSSFTWYEEDDDLVEGAFNYATILNFIKSEWESISAEISKNPCNSKSKVVYYKA